MAVASCKFHTAGCLPEWKHPRVHRMMTPAWILRKSSRPPLQHCHTSSTVLNNTFLDLKEFKCGHELKIYILHCLHILNLFLEIKILSNHIIHVFATECFVHGKYFTIKFFVSGLDEVIDAIFNLAITSLSIVMAGTAFLSDMGCVLIEFLDDVE